jgi:small-conductance mechanosensitive channel
MMAGISSLRRYAAKLTLVAIAAAVVTLVSMGKLDHVINYLNAEALTLSVGDFQVSPYSLVKALFAIFALFSIAGLLLKFVETRIRRFRRVNFSNRQLLIKTSQIITYLITFLITLRVVGIDLKAFAILGGGIGIGIGIGLQKISSNFISGIILLFERTLQKDDLIELDDHTSGFVRKIRGRYTLIETLDNKEIMIPNEDLITQRVTNCTMSNKRGRISVNVGVTYSSDVHQVRALIIEAALEVEDCLRDPSPKCCLTEFGDSSVNFTLYFWMKDVARIVAFTKSEVMFKIWDKFKANGIEIPFPQRDINFKNPIKIDILK